MVASVSGGCSSQPKQKPQLRGRHQASGGSKEPETPVQGRARRDQAPAIEPPEEHDDEDGDEDDDLDEEAELRLCALEAKTASTRKDAVEDRAAGAAIEDEDNDTIEILDSDEEDEAAAAVPALSPADRFQKALALVRENIAVGTSDETTKEALRETAEKNRDKPVSRWAEDALIWLTEQDDNKQEIQDMALAMAVSLAEKKPLKEESDERIKEIFRRSAVLKEVESWMPHPNPLLRDTIVDFLDLEGKCKKWWTGVDGYFEQAAVELRGLLKEQQQQQEEEEGKGQGPGEASGSGGAGESTAEEERRIAEADGEAGEQDSPAGNKRRRRSGRMLPAAKRKGSKAGKGPAQASPRAKEGTTRTSAGGTPETPASSSAKAAASPAAAETPGPLHPSSDQLNESVAQRLLGSIAAMMDEIKSDPSFLKPETTGPPAVFQPFWQKEQGIIELDHD